jgi:hypothetical protein
LLALHCKRCSSLIDGIRLHDVQSPVTLLLPKSFPYDGVLPLTVVDNSDLSPTRLTARPTLLIFA